MKVLPKRLMLPCWKKIVYCIRTNDVLYLSLLYITVVLLQDGGRETLSQRLTTNSYYVLCGV